MSMRIPSTDSGDLVSSKTSAMCSAEPDFPDVCAEVPDVNDNTYSVILPHESSIGVKATTTQFPANTKLKSSVVASAESSIDIKCETESQKDDCFIQSADDDKKFKTATSVFPLVELEKEIQHLLPDFKDNRVAKEMIRRNIEWYHNTPYASHHGGIWERLIRNIHIILSAVSSERTMSYDALTTYLTEVERILNDRHYSSLLQPRTTRDIVTQ
ncbi:unnamed protein product [Schistosoma mattheei]|uniref:Uncharacterized protein n=1 Tax=Schistosoma mattheei TaxID=31246 RepID=A0A183NVZ5_9TREM|nr:unnamed protein product [Schistosoma mattheei]